MRMTETQIKSVGADRVARYTSGRFLFSINVIEYFIRPLNVMLFWYVGTLEASNFYDRP